MATQVTYGKYWQQKFDHTIDRLLITLYHDMSCDPVTCERIGVSHGPQLSAVVSLAPSGPVVIWNQPVFSHNYAYNS